MDINCYVKVDFKNKKVCHFNEFPIQYQTIVVLCTKCCGQSIKGYNIIIKMYSVLGSHLFFSDIISAPNYYGKSILKYICTQIAKTANDDAS